MLLKAFEGGEQPGAGGDASCLLQVHLPAKANAIFSLNVVLVVVAVAAAFRALYMSRSQTTPSPLFPSPCSAHLHFEAGNAGTTFRLCLLYLACS